MKLFIRLKQLEEIPRFYGLVYNDFSIREAVYAPLGFNIAARIVVDIYWRIVQGLFKSRWEEKLGEAHRNGFVAGQKAEQIACKMCVGQVLRKYEAGA